MTSAPAGDLEAGDGPNQNAFLAFASQGVGAVFSIGLTIFLVRYLGPADYGVLALAVSIGAFVLLGSDLGISISAARFAAEDPTNRVHVASVLRTALGLKVIASLIVTVALILLAPLIAEAYDTPDLTLAIRLIAVTVAAQGIGGLFIAWFIALGRTSLHLRYSLIESTVETSGSIAFVLLGGGAAGAVAGRGLGFTAAAILAIALAIRLLGWQSVKSAPVERSRARQILSYGAALLVIDGAFAIFDRVDVLLIGAILSPAAAGIFEAAVRMLTFLQYLGIALAAGYAPRLATGQRAEADALRFVQALRYAMLIYLLVAAGAIAWADPAVQLLLGDAYSDAAPVLRALAPTIVLSGLGPILAGGANYVGDARRRMPFAVGALLINIIIDLILIPEIGIVAGAIGTGVAFAVYVGGHLWICQRALGMSFGRLVPALGRGLVAGAIAVGVLVAFGTEDLGVLDWIAGPVAATLAYFGALILMRELSSDEVRRVGDAIRSRIPGGRSASGD